MKRFTWIFLLWPSLGNATKVSVTVQPCPMGEGMVKVYEKLSSNTQGGFDSDLAAYSSKGQFREYAISTCTDNLLSLHGADMLRSWSDEEKLIMKGTLDRLQTHNPEGLGDHILNRYMTAAEIYSDLGKPPLFMAELYLQASWVSRDMVVGVFLGLEGPVQARQMLDAGNIDLKKNLTVEQRKLLLHNLSRIAHRGGYGTQRDRYIEAFGTLPLSSTEAQALVQMRQGIEMESHFQTLAIESFSKGLSVEGLDMGLKIRATYLLADLLRRSGNLADSVVLFGLIIAEEDAPTELRGMALVLSEEMAETSPELFREPDH